MIAGANSREETTMRRFTVCAWVLMVMSAVPGCSGDKPESEPVIRPVRTMTVYSTGAGRTRTFSGTAEAGIEASLSFKVAGTVREVPVKVGDRVEKGDLLAALDPADYRLQVQEAEASLTRAQAESRNARSDYDRVRSLYENNNASRNDLDAARAGAESAEAQMKSAEKRLEQARLHLSYTRLSAPMAGAVSSVDVEVNENVAVGTPVVQLTGGSDIEVKVSVPEALISSIREGDPATVEFDALSSGQSMTGTVTEVGVSTGRGATTYPVTVRLEGNPDEIRPGMTAQVQLRFPGSGDKDRFLVPPGAVGEDREGRFVFLAEAAGEGMGVVKRREVEVGGLTDEGLEILSGLEEGDLLVTAGVNKLQDGTRVRIDTGS